MFNVEEDIAKVVAEGNKKEMEKLSEILDDVIYVVKDYDEELFKKYAMCIYKMANGDSLTREVGEHIVKEMKPYGEHWTIEQTTNVKNQYGYTDINDVDFWVVMNSAYNDYNDIFKDNVDVYAKWARAFIKDEDARDYKLLSYYL